MIRRLGHDNSYCIALFTAICILSVGCDSKSSAPGSPSPPENTVSLPNASRNRFGSCGVSGKIVLGEAPRQSSGYLMSGDVYCARVGEGKKIIPDGRRIGANGGLPFVFIHVTSGLSGAYDAPPEAVVLDQKGCHYEPHVFGLMINQPLEIRNSDPTAHNVHAQALRNDSFNIAQAQQNTTAIKRFERREVMIKIKCDVHSWMEAYAGVLPHPFYSVSDEGGHYSISRLPAGEYTLEAWHELYGRRELKVTLKEDQQIKVDFSFARRP